jgi:rRNA maturation protein Nop10
MELDSRMGPPSAFDSIKVKDATPSQFSDPDPFSKVRTKE